MLAGTVFCFRTHKSQHGNPRQLRLLHSLLTALGLMLALAAGWRFLGPMSGPGPQKLAAQPHAAQPRLPRRPRPSVFFGFERARRRVYCTELRASSFAKCSEQLREATYLAKSTPFAKQWSPYLLIHRALLLLPSPPPSFLPPLSFSPLFVHLRCP
jgi:hypothetical protein